MKTRILYLVRSYGMGGVQSIVRLLLTHLPRDEFDITVVPYDTGSEHDRAFFQSIESEGIELSRDRIVWRGPQDCFGAHAKIRELVDKYQIDIIHTHDDQSNTLVGIGRQAWPCARVASAYGWFEPKWNFNLKTQYAIERRFALPNFDCIYTVSENMRNKIVRSGTKPERVRVIHTGIQVEQFNPRGQRQAIRSQLGIARDALVVGTVSRLSAEKGHRYLLNAAQSLLRTLPQLALLCVGGGDQRPSLEAQARRLGLTERVHFTGFYDDLPGIFEAMDIFAFPSILDEGLPTAVLEAQAAGLPIVASDIGGTCETLDIGVSGVLVKPADSADLAIALGDLLANDQRRQHMAAKARQWVQNNFSLTKMIDKMVDLYLDAHSQRMNSKGCPPGGPVA